MPIRTDAGCNWTVTEIARYFETSPRAERPMPIALTCWRRWSRRYERREHPIPLAAPAEVIRFYMDGMAQADFAQVPGLRSRASEVLSGRRSLTVGHDPRDLRHLAYPSRGAHRGAGEQGSLTSHLAHSGFSGGNLPLDPGRVLSAHSADVLDRDFAAIEPIH
ncbi:hypothetical protein [Gluconacetobacter tumulisoli]|uniref:hypothetical protein n=1 Tax=Gluconacetobacter tumulisoli TaxID=1286189 RepID=UPI001C818053|nr:hypothetical protein [Gluconacetobacter tumulisoli]